MRVTTTKKGGILPTAKCVLQSCKVKNDDIIIRGQLKVPKKATLIP